MTYELLKNKMLNGTPFTKIDAKRWIVALPLSVLPEQVKELEQIAEEKGLDFLPEDGKSRLEAVDAQATYTAMMTDTMMEV